MDINSFLEEANFDEAARRNQERQSQANQEAEQLENMEGNNDCKDGCAV